MEVFIVVKKRNGHSKWERTGSGPSGTPGSDVFFDENEAKEKLVTYKKNVPSWSFAYIVMGTDGKVLRIMEIE